MSFSEVRSRDAAFIQMEVSDLWIAAVTTM